MNQKRKSKNPIKIAEKCMKRHKRKHGGVFGCMNCRQSSCNRLEEASERESIVRKFK